MNLSFSIESFNLSILPKFSDLLTFLVNSADYSFPYSSSVFVFLKVCQWIFTVHFSDIDLFIHDALLLHHAIAYTINLLKEEFFEFD